VHSWASLLYFVYLLMASREPAAEAMQRAESWRVAA